MEEKTEKPKIPKNVLEGIKEVRDSGKTNMFDVNTVAALCARNDNSEAGNWVLENKELYAKLIFYGPDAFQITN